MVRVVRKVRIATEQSVHGGKAGSAGTANALHQWREGIGVDTLVVGQAGRLQVVRIEAGEQRFFGFNQRVEVTAALAIARHLIEVVARDAEPVGCLGDQHVEALTGSRPAGDCIEQRLVAIARGHEVIVKRCVAVFGHHPGLLRTDHADAAQRHRAAAARRVMQDQQLCLHGAALGRRDSQRYRTAGGRRDADTVGTIATDALERAPARGDDDGADLQRQAAGVAHLNELLTA